MADTQGFDFNHKLSLEKYADIINLPRPISTTHPHLSIAQRAAQFAPYKTITAYHDSTDELEENSDILEFETIPDNSQLENFDEFYIDETYEDPQGLDLNNSADYNETQ